MNKVIFMGRLTRDPEVRYGGATGGAIARYSIAVDRRFKREGQPEADFFNCTAFGKLGEFSGKYLRKGTKIELESHVTPGSYEKDGRKVYTYDFQADKIDFAESKNASQGNNTGNRQPASDSGEDDGFMDIPDGIDEELPFN